jgi:hypothetical protein
MVDLFNKHSRCYVHKHKHRDPLWQFRFIVSTVICSGTKKVRYEETTKIIYSGKRRSGNDLAFSDEELLQADCVTLNAANSGEASAVKTR